MNYDAWFDLTNLEISGGNWNRVRDTFEEAIKNIPPRNEKKFWKRYIYLWINYAMFEELDANDIEKAKAIYERMIKMIPHKEFTFAKVWIMYANFYIRCKDIDSARKVYGMAIGKAPSEKIFLSYIELE